MEPERDKDVPNKHNPPPPNALSRSNALRRGTCVFAHAFEKMRESDEGGNRKRASVFWVCLKASGLVSETVFPVCHGLKGLLLLFSSPVFSVSPSPPGSSSTPAPCSRHGRAGQGFLSNWRPREYFIHSLCFPPSLPPLSSRLAHSIPNEKRRIQKWTQSKLSVFQFFFFFFKSVNKLRYRKC